MTDKELIRKRFSGAGAAYGDAAVVQRDIAAALSSMIDMHVPGLFRDRILEVGCGTGFLTRRLAADTAVKELFINDICSEFSSFFEDLPSVKFIPGDAELIDFPSGIGLIASSSVIQWFDSQESFFHKCRKCLRSGGYLAFSTFGPGNLYEIYKTTGSGLPYRSLDSLIAMLSPEFDIVHSFETFSVLRFSSPVEVLRHLKQTGVNGIRRRLWTRSDLADFTRRYLFNFAVSDTGSGCTLTYHPLYVVAQARK